MSDVVNHLDLFSGIGGFALAAKWVWGKDHNIHSFVEIDPFCQKVLKKHWPDVPIISNIKEYEHDGTTIDLLTGGFPCQPFSCAGKQRGKKDDRYLWPEMLRIISEVRPTWIIGENVAGIINMGLDQVLSDLENTGYTCQSFIIPACSVNAPHRRDRVWIVANSESANNREQNGQVDSTRQIIGRRGTEIRAEPTRQNSNVTNSNRLNGNNARHGSSEVSQLKETEVCGLQTITNTSHKRLQGGKRSGTHEEKKAAFRSASECNNTWDEPWLEAATRLCGIYDGIPRRMDRVNRLKALGNAIVPQVVAPIMQVIKELECLTSQQN